MLVFSNKLWQNNDDNTEGLCEAATLHREHISEIRVKWSIFIFRENLEVLILYFAT